jgi:hypothetical protein
MRYSTIISFYYLQYTYEVLIRALEPYYDDRKLSLAFCLLSRANLCKVAILVSTSNQYKHYSS